MNISFQTRVREHLKANNFTNDGSEIEAHETIISELLESFGLKLIEELARMECSYCQRGDPVRVMVHRKQPCYGHRGPYGKSATHIWMPCRASVIWHIAHQESESPAPLKGDAE